MPNSPIDRVIAELHKELARISQVICMLETLLAGKPRRGRPPKMLAEVMKESGAKDLLGRKRRGSSRAALPSRPAARTSGDRRTL